jgi:hypothetical protein
MRDSFFGGSTADQAAAMTPAKEPAQLPTQPTDDADLGIVPPDHPAVQVETNDKTVTHSICHTQVIVPGAALDNPTGKIYCPTCRAEFPIDTFATERRAQV